MRHICVEYYDPEVCLDGEVFPTVFYDYATIDARDMVFGNVDRGFYSSKTFANARVPYGRPRYDEHCGAPWYRTGASQMYTDVLLDGESYIHEMPNAYAQGWERHHPEDIEIRPLSTEILLDRSNHNHPHFTTHPGFITCIGHRFGKRDNDSPEMWQEIRAFVRDGIYPDRLVSGQHRQ